MSDTCDHLSWQFSLALGPLGYGGHAGVDEVGVGPLAGPVTACAVLLDPARRIPGLEDSKALTAARREALDAEIRDKALAYCLGWASEREIDDLNILRASHLAMRRACDGLAHQPSAVFVNGNKTFGATLPCVTVVKGDRRVPQISAASIVAKVARDAHMQALDERLPMYGFAKHKGYPTKQHMQALESHGASEAHRMSFAPVAAVVETAAQDQAAAGAL